MDSKDYKHYCKFCKAKPFVPGPHHSNTCRRWQATIDMDSKEASRYECKHCKVKPFVAGSHHKESCPRYKKPFSFSAFKPDRMSSIELKESHEKGERFTQAWNTEQLISKVKRGW